MVISGEGQRSRREEHRVFWRGKKYRDFLSRNVGARSLWQDFFPIFSDFIIDTVSIPCINFFYISEIKIVFGSLSNKMELKDT